MVEHLVRGLVVCLLAVGIRRGAVRAGAVPGRTRAAWAVAGVLVALGALVVELVPPGLAVSAGVVAALLGWTGGAMVSACIGALCLVSLVRAAPERTLRVAYLRVVEGLVWVFLATALLSFTYWYGQPRAWANLPDADGLVCQSTGVTCGAAAGAMLLAHHGLRVSEGQVAVSATTSPLLGTDNCLLAHGLDQLVRPLHLRARIGALSELRRRRPGTPYVASTWLPGLGWHAVVVEPTAGRTTVADPLSGQRALAAGLTTAGLVVWVEPQGLSSR